RDTGRSSVVVSLGPVDFAADPGRCFHFIMSHEQPREYLQQHAPFVASSPKQERHMSTSPETDALRQDLEQLRKDFSALSDSLKQRSNEQLQAGMESARHRVDELGGVIQSRPCTSVLTAFGVGLLVGKILGR